MRGNTLKSAVRAFRRRSGPAVCLLICLTAFAAGPARAQQPAKLRLTLRASVELALKHNPQMWTALAQVEEASAKLGQARTNFFPKLLGSANYTRLDIAPFIPVKSFSKVFGGGAGGQPPTGIPAPLPKKITIGDDKNYAISVQLRQPIFTGGMVWNGYRMAKLGEDAAALNVKNTKSDLRLKVEEAYWGIVKTNKLLQVADLSIKQVEAHVRDLENMFKVGLVTRNEVLKARLQLSNVRLMRISTEKAQHLAKANFCNLIGVPLETELELVDTLAYMEPESLSLEQVRREALANRLDLKMLELNRKISEKAVRLSEAGYLPNLYLVADYGYRRPDREYNPEFYSTWTVSLVAQWRLFDWGERYYKQQESEAQLQRIRSTYKSARDGILLQVTQDYFALKEAEQKVVQAKLALEQAEENFRITSDYFKQGMVTNTEYLDASSQVIQARSNYVTSLADYRIARARLLKSMGRL